MASQDWGANHWAKTQAVMYRDHFPTKLATVNVTENK